MYVLWVFLVALPLCCARQPGELFDALQLFLEGIIASSATIDAGSSASVLSADCVGRFNGAFTLVGIENNTEFLYGISSSLSQTDDVQLIGYPISAEVKSLSIQLSVVATSVVFSLYYRSLNTVIPLQVDMWISYTDDLLIAALDINARRGMESLEYLQPLLVPLLNEEGNDVQSVIGRKAARDICQAAMKHCSGDNVQYDSLGSCFDELSVVGFTSDVQLCRYLEKELVKTNPDVHCPSLGSSGGSRCGQKDYIETTTTYPFRPNFVAANASVPGVSDLSVSTQLELFKMNMEQYYSTTVGFYAVPTLLYLLFLYISAKCSEKLFTRFSSVYTTLTFENQRNTITYALNTFYTTVAFAIQLFASPILMENYSVVRISALRAGASIVTALYLFELIYRPTMRMPLLIHHFCTIFAISFVVISAQISLNPATLTAGLIWSFQATTEQSIFIALLLYRLRYHKHLVKNLLKFAAIQSFLFKMGFAIYLISFWGMKLVKFHAPNDIALSVIIVAITSLLMSTQVYGSWAVWSIARNIDRRNSAYPTLSEAPLGLGCERTVSKRSEKNNSQEAQMPENGTFAETSTSSPHSTQTDLKTN